MEIGGLSGLSMIHMPRMNITADKTESYVWYGSSTTPRPVTVKSTTRPIVRTISSTEVEDEIIIEEEEEEIVEYNEPIYPIDTLQISTESDCIEPLNFEQLSNIKPKYQTDANSFLVPILIWGPNNQVVTLNLMPTNALCDGFVMMPVRVLDHIKGYQASDCIFLDSRIY